MKKLIVTASALCAAAGPMSAQSSLSKPPTGEPQSARDTIDLPPIERQVFSASGVFKLTLRSLDDWKTRQVTATLTGAGGRVLWHAVLPHDRGPRLALVTNDGYVLLVNDWVNSVSPRALTLLGPDGGTRARYSSGEIFAVLGVPLATITAEARFGVWITSGPHLSPDAKSAAFRAGGRMLSINLSDGHLSVTTE